MPSLRDLILGNISQSTAEGGRIGSQAAQSSMDAEQQAKLKQMLFGSELSQKKQMLDTLKGENPNSSVSAEGLAVHPKDESTTALKQQRLAETEKEHKEQAITNLSKQMEKGGYPAITQSLKEVETALPKAGEKDKSLTGLASFVPTAALPFTERLYGLTGGKIGTEPGAVQERQAVETAKMLMRHPLFGSALTKSEKQSFDNALGILNGGTPGDMQQALRRMKELTQKGMKGVEAGARPEALSEYRQRGGSSSEEVMRPPSAPQSEQALPSEQSPMSPARARLEALRAKARGK
jgi:hypothetical protein